MATDAHREDCFVLRFPFQVLGNHEIGELDVPCTSRAGTLGLKLKHDGQLYVLTVEGFLSSEAAEEFVGSIRAALFWLLLKRSIPFQANLSFRRVVYADDPVEAARNVARSWGLNQIEPLDGTVDGGGPSVYPADKRIRTITAGPISGHITYPAAQVLEDLVEGYLFTGSLVG
jgi:hypothetical protein